MRQIQRIVAIRHANVDVLTKHREGLGQIAVFFMQMEEALARRNALFVPMLERMRATTGDIDIEMLGTAIQRRAQALQFFDQFIHAGMNAGIEFDHALRHFQLDLLLQITRRNPGQQVHGIAGQVVVAPVDQLQFQLDPHGERRR